MRLGRRNLIVSTGIVTAGLAGLPIGARRAWAAQLSFAPVIIEAPSGPFTTTLDVTSQGGGETMIQARVLGWSQPETGGDALAPTELVSLSPPAFRLPEGETQTIRLVFRTRDVGAEQAFRVLLDEVPQPRADGGLQFALRVSLPAFVGARGLAFDLQWQARRGDGRTLAITAANRGRRHIRVSRLTVTPQGGAAVAAQLPEQLPYVLAGGTRHWTVTLARPLAAAAVRVDAETDGGPLSFTLPVEA
jgi:fimbrial chaperone protein